MHPVKGDPDWDSKAWLENMRKSIFKTTSNYEPSESLMKLVGFDFNEGHELSGQAEPKPSRTWIVWVGMVIPALLMLVNFIFGCGVMAGILYGAVGCLILLEPDMGYGGGYK